MTPLSHEILTREHPQDGATLIWVPAGPFTMGSSDADVDALVAAHPGWDRRWFVDEQPQRTVKLAGYWIYQTPVTVAQYRTFCEATARALPPAPEWGWLDDHPMVNVSYRDATDYAVWAGAALPTEAQWEKAARSDDGRWWPWGNTPDDGLAVFGSDCTSTAPVGSCAAGASPYGVLDMAGNVWEWCEAAPLGEYLTAPPPASTYQRRPTTPSGHVMRGGAWHSADIAYLRCAYRCRDCDAPRRGPTYRRTSCGFRCVVPGE